MGASQVQDDYRENLMRVIKAKMKGKEPTSSSTNGRATPTSSI